MLKIDGSTVAILLMSLVFATKETFDRDATPYIDVSPLSIATLLCRGICKKGLHSEADTTIG